MEFDVQVKDRIVGVENILQRRKSGLYIHNSNLAYGCNRVIGTEVAHFLHTEGVAGSNPASPTNWNGWCLNGPSVLYFVGVVIMTTNSIHRRRSIRLKGYHYAQNGAYFVTLCTHNRECLFGDIVNGTMNLNGLGNVAKQCWEDIPKHFPHVELDEWVIMPNHIHGIICIVGAKNFSPQMHEMGNDLVPFHNDAAQLPNDSSQIIDGFNATHLGANGSYGASYGANDYLPLRQHGTSKTIGSIVRGFKIGVTKWARNVGANHDLFVAKNFSPHRIWQRNYYEHIIRNEKSLHNIREYIFNNPKNWHLDKMYFSGVKP